jgi:hypothetical protein
LIYVDNAEGMNSGGAFSVVIGEIHGSAGETYTLPRCNYATSDEFAAICIIDKETGLQRQSYLFNKAVHGTYMPMGMNSTEEGGSSYEWTYGYYDKFDFSLPKDGEYLIVLYVYTNNYYSSCIPRNYNTSVVLFSTSDVAYIFENEAMIRKTIK